MYTITKEFHFSASHILNGMEERHPCGRLHGHNYKVKVELKSYDLDKTQMVQDYGDLKPIKEWIDDTLDHRHLNDVILENPTAESIAHFIFWHWSGTFPMLSAVEVSETDKTWARYEE